VAFFENDELHRAFDRVREMPYGSGQIAAVEQLIRQADAAGDEFMSFASRMLATTAYVYGGEPARSFVTFSWCLAHYDNNPRPWHQRYEHSLLWYFKYMVNGLLSFPEVPLDRTTAVLDDMERRYREGGHSLQAVYKMRHRVARHLGAADEAEKWYRRWTTTPRDDLSDCAGCDPTTQISYLASRGRDEEAVALAEPVLAGRLNCTEQPQGVLTALLMPYLRTGRREQARQAHLRAYRRHRGNLADLWDIGEHVTFCAVTGNEVRGLELLERHLDWLDRSPSPAATMNFAAAAALLLRRLDATGPAGLTVRRPGHGDRPAAEVPVGELAEEMAATAREVAARFDARNGTTAQSELVARQLALTPVGDYLPLSATARRRPTAGAGQPSAAGTAADATDRPAAPEAGARPADGPEAAPFPVRRTAPLDLPAEATPMELLDLADELWRTDRDDDRATVLAAFDERFGGQEHPPSVVARRVEYRAAERHRAGDLAGAVELSREAVRLHRQVPDPVREQVVASRLGVLLVLTGEPEEGLALARASADYLAEHGSAGQRAAAQDRLSIALIETGHGDEALTAADLAAADAADADDPHLIARIALRRVRLLELLNRPAEAGEAALRARDLYRKLGLVEPYAVACLGYANSLDDPARAVEAYDEVVRVATADLMLPARSGRARALVAAGRPAEAVDDLVEAVAICVERDIADGAAFLRAELADVYRRAGRMVEAAEAAEEAVGALDRLGHQADADRCRHMLAGIYLSLGEHGPALTLLDELAENLDGPDNLPHRAQVLEEAGQVLYNQDRDNLAAQRFAAAATAYQAAGRRLDELRARRREVLALCWAGDSEAALAALERADAVSATLPADPWPAPADASGGDRPANPADATGGDRPAGPADAEEEPGEESGFAAAVRWERAMLADAGARALLAAGRENEALDRLAGVADRLRSIEAFGEAFHVDLLTGELLVRTDRPAEAERLLRSTLAGLPNQSDLVPRAAWWLAEALSALGRTDEAEAVRAEYSLNPDQ
jgi:tetratricopeptide (TPR) repeat protein